MCSWEAGRLDTSCFTQVTVRPPPSPAHPAITARAALDLSTQFRNLRDHHRLFDNAYAALRGKLAIVGHIVDRSEFPRARASRSSANALPEALPPYMPADTETLVPLAATGHSGNPRIMLRGGVAATADLVDIKNAAWSAVPAARTQDMQASAEEAGEDSLRSAGAVQCCLLGTLLLPIR